MSICRPDGRPATSSEALGKIPKHGRTVNVGAHENPLLDHLLATYVGKDKQKLRYLAALSLRSMGWRLEDIGLVLGWKGLENRGRVHHVLQALQQSLREHLAVTPAPVSESPADDPESSDCLEPL